MKWEKEKAVLIPPLYKITPEIGADGSLGYAVGKRKAKLVPHVGAIYYYEHFHFFRTREEAEAAIKHLTSEVI